MNNETMYKGMILARNSWAYALYHDKHDVGHKSLNKHLKELEVTRKELMTRYDKK